MQKGAKCPLSVASDWKVRKESQIKHDHEAMGSLLILARSALRSFCNYASAVGRVENAIVLRLLSFSPVPGLA